MVLKQSDVALNNSQELRGRLVIVSSALACQKSDYLILLVGRRPPLSSAPKAFTDFRFSDGAERPLRCPNTRHFRT